jgi:hypothetical protein
MINMRHFIYVLFQFFVPVFNYNILAVLSLILSVVHIRNDGCGIEKKGKEKGNSRWKGLTVAEVERVNGC